MYTRDDVTFDVRGVRCGAWMYRPLDIECPPVVVMAHGFGAHRTYGLPPVAERFAHDGMAVLLFDHRYHGASGGEPRGLVDPFRQLDDWRAAIEFARGDSRLDGERLALWGTSFSGGHVISLAAENPSIAAIVAQVPYVDPVSTAGRMGPLAIGRLLFAGALDLVRSVFGGAHRIPVAGRPGTTACMATEDSFEGYRSLVGNEPWENRCPARSAFAFAQYRPMWRAKHVRCPAFVALAEQDTLIAPHVVERAARKMEAELVRLPCGHFDVYIGPQAEMLGRMQSDFLRRHLGVMTGVECWRSRAA